MVHVPKDVTLATRSTSAPIAVRRIGAEFTSEEKEIMKSTVAKGTTDLEFAWFLHVAKEVGLSPLRRQIHAVKRWSKKDQKEVMTIQTGIDGFRAIADRTGNYAPSDRKPETVYDDKGRLFSITSWAKKFVPKDRSWHEINATALWDEFVPMEVVDGERKMPFMWAKMPWNQLEKCAEAKCLRRGFPELEGIYVHEELARADAEAGGATPGEESKDGEPKVVTRESLEAQRRSRERGTLEHGKVENRGHGDEGFLDEGPKPGTRAVSPEDKKKEQKQEAKQAALETIDSTVVKIAPMLKKLTPDQVNENKIAKAQKKPEPHEPQPYFIVTLRGDISIFVWDKHMFRAIAGSGGKAIEWKVAKRKTATKEYLGLEQIVSIDGVKYVVDAESKEWVPVTSLKTQVPATPDTGESAPVDKSANPRQPTIIEGGNSLFSE
jgi:phage recombination protein Bet